jgi:hypothetical protein
MATEVTLVLDATVVESLWRCLKFYELDALSSTDEDAIIQAMPLRFNQSVSPKPVR